MKSDQTWTVAADEDGQRLDKHLAAAGRAGSRSRAADAIARGRVFVNGEEIEASGGARLVRAGEQIRLWIDRPGSASKTPRPPARDGLEIIHEDADLVLVNKPAGLLSVPLDGDSAAPSVLAILWDRYRSHRTREPLVVHRIDKDTSGLVLFALHDTARSALMAQFAHRTPDRIYMALVNGHPEPAEGTWHDRLVWDDDAFVQRRARPEDEEAKDAECDYRVVTTFEESSLIEVRLYTGRQGQIRAQAQMHGHSLVGDRRYRPREGAPGFDLRFPRQALHAQRLAFDHPADGRRVEFTAPMPPDLRDFLDKLRRQARQRVGTKVAPGCPSPAYRLKAALGQRGPTVRSRVDALEEPREQPETRWAPRELWSGVSGWMERHETQLWWLHSVWALAFGIGVMWLGARNFAYLRIAILHVAFIWATSMALPFIVRSGSLSRPWRLRVQLVVNYFNKNFYQQLLFFILPIYWLSTTPGSRNVLFVVLLATAAAAVDDGSDLRPSRRDASGADGVVLLVLGVRRCRRGAADPLADRDGLRALAGGRHRRRRRDHADHAASAASTGSAAGSRVASSCSACS